jgi:putative membrane protein
MKKSALHKRYRREVWKGAASGAVAGLVGSWTMNQFQSAWSKVSEKLEPTPDQQQPSSSDNEDATMKVAELFSETLLHRQLTKAEKKKLGPVVHYGFGTVMGAIYGAVAEVKPRTRAGHGALLGSVLFAGADELAVPVLHLSERPDTYPISAHAKAFAAHCVYGVTTESVRELLRRRW